MLFLFACCYFLQKFNSEEKLQVQSLKSKQIIPWGVNYINAPLLWSRGVTGKNVRVAVLDTGVDIMHPDLSRNLRNGYNTINPSSLPIDDNGHGTMVAGIIAAQNNNIGVTGVSPDVELYPIKVLDRFGEGEIPNVIKGIDWCVNNNIDVMNLSFSIMKDNERLHKSIKKALDSGIIIIASGSNTSGGPVGYPASYDGVFSVTSINKSNIIGDTSPKGKIDFSAPGVDILTTSLNGNYKVTSGTSFSAPHITGLIALILQQHSKFNQKDIYERLRSFSKDLGESGKDSTFGEGIVILK
ncbi:S8 family peptidase [Paenibacillus polymyxa]|uniref:S8 family peptidase n=1 Tax=Paenibacillus polymyxa TaxID=1406 RepID=UPI00287FAD10|nr:S8 family peptidase [Paenibacillus polymyxa]